MFYTLVREVLPVRVPDEVVLNASYRSYIYATSIRIA